jgi:hypothetical protein
MVLSAVRSNFARPVDPPFGKANISNHSISVMVEFYTFLAPVRLARLDGLDLSKSEAIRLTKTAKAYHGHASTVVTS